jgi:hypothetical protein
MLAWILVASTPVLAQIMNLTNLRRLRISSCLHALVFSLPAGSAVMRTKSDDAPLYSKGRAGRYRGGQEV